MAKKRVKRKNPASQSKECLFMSDLSFLLVSLSHTHNKHSEQFLQALTASLSHKTVNKTSSLVAVFPPHLFHCDSEAVSRQPAHHLDTHNVENKLFQVNCVA